MAHDVASSINDLLFQNQSVIIPGFGGFVLNEHSANIDYIKSTITPPSKVPSFNKNLTLNDGILVNHIKQQNRCTLEQANQIIKDFVVAAEQKIEAKEIIEFPKVGRLYKDYNQSLQFLPYDTNFNTNAFGLPVIEVHPFSRNGANTSTTETATVAAVGAATAITTASEPEVNKTIKTQKETPVKKVKVVEKVMKEEEKVATIPLGGSQSKGVLYWIQKALPLLLIISLGVMAFSYFTMQKGSDVKKVNTDSTASLTLGGDDKKINTSPSIDEAEITPITDSDDEIGYDSGEDDNEDSNSEASTSYDSNDSTTGRECIVIVGQFSSKENAESLVSQVENNGYESYMGWNSDKGWNTVGVKFSYKSESEKNRMHRKLKNEYDSAAWILRD